MSIVQLKKITLYAPYAEKEIILDELQSLGCLHLVPLTTHEDLLDKEEANRSTQTRNALRHLMDSPQKLKQVREDPTFDPIVIEQEILENKRKIDDLQDELDGLKGEISELEPWGNFVMPNSEELGGLNLWFYKIPHKEVKNISRGIVVQVIKKDNLFTYLLVISENQPESMPGEEAKLSKQPLSQLKKRVEEIEFELEERQLQRTHLTRWLTLFEKNLFRLEDRIALSAAKKHTLDKETIFALQGWVPEMEVKEVKAFAKRKGIALHIEDPKKGEIPPTLLENDPSLKGGEDLLSFYMTPSYWLWDPSTTIFFSFAVFFAMIFSDAGYAIILGAIVAFFWKKMGQTLTGRRFRNVLVALTIFSLIWGILVGSYFGVSPSGDNIFRKLKVIDMSNYAAMMTLAIIVGVIHIALANLAQAWAKRRSLTALANLGWATALIGAILTFIGIRNPESLQILKTVGIGLIVLGLGGVISFTTLERPLWKRFLKGSLELTRISGMFGDVLSYLRLFALGLASASLAGVFNDLAMKVYQAMPGFKFLFALLILLIGHAMNFALSVMSGFIHGLRLNFIEFFNWGIPEEGIPFKAFSKKEMSKWNR